MAHVLVHLRHCLCLKVGVKAAFDPHASPLFHRAIEVWLIAVVSDRSSNLCQDVLGLQAVKIAWITSIDEYRICLVYQWIFRLGIFSFTTQSKNRNVSSHRFGQHQTEWLISR